VRRIESVLRNGNPATLHDAPQRDALQGVGNGVRFLEVYQCISPEAANRQTQPTPADPRTRLTR
jgi:hypothetical protein